MYIEKKKQKKKNDHNKKTFQLDKLYLHPLLFSYNRLFCMFKHKVKFYIKKKKHYKQTVLLMFFCRWQFFNLMLLLIYNWIHHSQNLFYFLLRTFLFKIIRLLDSFFIRNIPWKTCKIWWNLTYLPLRFRQNIWSIINTRMINFTYTFYFIYPFYFKLESWKQLQN